MRYVGEIAEEVDCSQSVPQLKIVICFSKSRIQQATYLFIYCEQKKTYLQFATTLHIMVISFIQTGYPLSPDTANDGVNKICF